MYYSTQTQTFFANYVCIQFRFLKIQLDWMNYAADQWLNYSYWCYRASTITSSERGASLTELVGNGNFVGPWEFTPISERRTMYGRTYVCQFHPWFCTATLHSCTCWIDLSMFSCRLVPCLQWVCSRAVRPGWCIGEHNWWLFHQTFSKSRQFFIPVKNSTYY